MAELFITIGWLGDLLCTLWVFIILADIIAFWIPSVKQNPGTIVIGLDRLALPPVNMIRRMIPTVYRGVDFAPWMTMLLLVLIKTFACRAIVYWGMLHRG